VPAPGPVSLGVTAPAGFRAAAATAGLKASGAPDVAVVVNDGPRFDAAGVFTSNRVKAAPVRWCTEILGSAEGVGATGGLLHAVVLNSGGANACTGPAGFADTVATATHLAGLLEVAPEQVAVCSTGLIGERLPMDTLLAGVSAATGELTADGGPAAATAIMTTDTVPKTAVVHAPAGWSVGGMAKGAGMLAPGLATMLVVLTTDAQASAADLDTALRRATRVTFDRLDSDGAMSTNDTVLLLASGASGVVPSLEQLAAAVTRVCADLAGQLLADAEGATKEIAIEVRSAVTQDEAVAVGRAVARDNLVKTAFFGQDPNWGRILAAVGAVPERTATFDADRVDVAVNGAWICRSGAASEVDRATVDLTGRAVSVTIDLHAGTESATVLTNDLSHAYVHENSAYST
jgi:glutamate N-acetyltransferase/amino-acid N-acetyltransferase